MKQVLLVFAIAAVVILGFGAAPALAQTRVFVSGLGSDSNPCSLSAPCRSFQQAHDTVLPGGEIVALDAAGYGSLSITKAVTVSAIGIEASITSNSGPAITINAGAGDVVAIRGLTIIGSGGSFGIQVLAAKSVTIRDCSISGFANDGIRINPSADLDVELRGVTSVGNSFNGLNLVPTGSGTLTALVTDSSFTGNGTNGVEVDGHNSTGTIKATLNVAAAANAVNGIFIRNAPGQAQIVVMVTGAKLVNNTQDDGLFVSGPAEVFVDRTQISGNSVGWQAESGAVVNSYTNNEVNGNGTDGLNGVTQITSE